MAEEISEEEQKQRIEEQIHSSILSNMNNLLQEGEEGAGLNSGRDKKAFPALGSARGEEGRGREGKEPELTQEQLLNIGKRLSPAPSPTMMIQ